MSKSRKPELSGQLSGAICRLYAERQNAREIGHYGNNFHDAVNAVIAHFKTDLNIDWDD